MKPKTTISHTGTCGFCGGHVKTNFPTCTGCGATWTSATTQLGQLLMVSAIFIAAIVAAFVGIAAHSLFDDPHPSAFGSHGMSMGSTVGLVTWGVLTFYLMGKGAMTARYAWYRSI